MPLIGRFRFGPVLRAGIAFAAVSYERRRIIYLAVTAHPDRIFGEEFVQQVRAMGIKQVLSAPRSPWQRAYVERVLGTIRRECLDHMIIFNERSLYRYVQGFLEYDHRNRTHLALEKDSPEPRTIQPPESGRIVSMPVIGGLHHRYERRVA